MAAIYSNGGNRWNIIIGSILIKEMRYLVYIRYCIYAIKSQIWILALHLVELILEC